VEEQVVVIFAGTRGYLDGLDVSAVGKFEDEFLRTMRDQHGGMLDDIRTSKELSSDNEDKLVKILDDFTKAFAA